LASIMDDSRWGIEAPVCFISLKSPMKWPVIFIVPLCLIICISSMVAICCHVYTQSKKISKYTYSVKQRQIRESENRKLVLQAMLYALAFFITFLFPIIMFWTNLNKRYYFPLEVLTSIFYPLQGFWNFLLFIRHSVIEMRRMTPDKYLIRIIWNVIFPQEEINAITSKKHTIKEDISTKRKVPIDPYDNDATIARASLSEETKEEITADKNEVKPVGQADIEPIDMDVIKFDIEDQSCAVLSNDHNENSSQVTELSTLGMQGIYTFRRTSLSILPRLSHLWKRSDT